MATVRNTHQRRVTELSPTTHTVIVMSMTVCQCAATRRRNTLEAMFTSAPASSSRSTTCLCSRLDASNSGVLPCCLDLAFTSAPGRHTPPDHPWLQRHQQWLHSPTRAPEAIRVSTQPRCPLYAARISGVSPSLHLASTTAPDAIKILHMEEWPCR